MMSERMAWMPTAKDTFTVSHNYADIKTQKISPDTKDKIQLQVVFTAGGANTFHFNNSAGRAQQIADRDAVKELLQQMLPRFKPKINNELAEKNRLLQTDPDLFRLYKELVVSEMMTADEFWGSRANKLKPVVEKDVQDVGVSAAFLADIRGQSDGCNGVKYNLTTDIIKSIFKTYPTVQQKHLEYVPDQMSEEDFWKQFFQSHYFHRDRINIAKDELFADCARQDDKTVESEIAKNEKNPLINLAAMSDHPVFQDDNKLEGADATSQINKSLIKRFNQHSTLVLKTCDKKRRLDDSNGSQQQQPDESINGTGGKHLTHAESTTTSADEASESSKQAKIKELIDLADLKDGPSSSTGPVLKLARLDPYLHGPIPVIGFKFTSSEEILNAAQAFTHDMLAWNTHPSQIVPSSNILLELSPGGALMQNCSTQQFNFLATSEVAVEAKVLYNTLAELLRHFWACFPITNKELEDKMTRLHGSLHRFKQNKLIQFSSKHYGSNLTSHMDKMIDVAFKKFEMWQVKKMKKSS